MARLINIGDDSKQSYPITGEAIKIGRLPDNHIVVTDALASRRHAEIRKVGDVFRVVDLNSLNGIYVNNLKVEDEQLAHGDIIAIGETRLLFENIASAEGGADSKPTAPNSPLAALDMEFGGSSGGGTPPRRPRDDQGPKPEMMGRAALSTNPIEVPDLPPPPEQDGPPQQVPGMAAPEIIKPVEEAAPDFSLEVVSLSDVFDRQNESQPAPRAQSSQSRNFFILYQVARALNSITDLGELLDLTMTLIFQVIRAERGVIFLYNEAGELVPAISRNRTGGELPEMTVSKTITQKAIDQRSAIITADACYDDRFKEGASIIAYNIRSALCVPLWDREKTRGAIYLDNMAESYAFTEDDLDLLSAIANQVAIAVYRDELQATMKTNAVFRANLERFHSPDVVNHIMQRSSVKEEAFKRYLEEKEVTVLFADITGFTPMMERLSAPEAAGVLAEYFDEMTDAVFEHKGTVDKFIGDAIMAIFGAPLSYGNDAELAVFAAIEMMKRLNEFKSQLAEDRRFDIRIGVNTGVVAAGYMGSRKRIEYSVLGDPVNVASRLESIAIPGTILVGEATYNKVRGAFSFKDRGSTLLKGKKHETRIFEVVF